MGSSIVHSLLEMGYKPIYAITLMVALWRYPKYYDTPLRFLPILYLYTFLNEVLGYLIKSNEDLALTFTNLTDNSAIYNLYTIISYLYYYYIFWSFSKNTDFRRNIVYGALVFLTSCVINIFLQHFVSDSQTLSYLVGGCILLYCTISFLRSFRAVPQNFALKQNLLFWISLGLTIFYMGYLPIKLLRFYNSIHDLSEDPVIRTIHLSLILMMYLLFIIGFLKMRRPLRNAI